MLFSLVFLFALLGKAQDSCSVFGVNYKSFGVSSLPYQFEELTSIYLQQPTCVNQYYEIEIWVDKNLFMATEQRAWGSHQNQQFEVRLFLAVKENYQEGKQYKPIIYELTPGRLISLRDITDKFRFKIYTDAPYEIISIGYKPINGWWDTNKHYIDDILTVSSVNVSWLERKTKQTAELDTVPVVSETKKAFKVDSLQGREVKGGSFIKASSAECKLLVFDHQLEDGDSISVNLNGDWIVLNTPLKKQPLVKTIVLKPGRNYLVLHAVNLGFYKPNTAAFHLVFENKVYKRILYSDLDKSDVLYIDL